MGLLASNGDSSLTGLKTAIACGIVTASFTVEDFSLGRLQQIGREEIDRRLDEYRTMISF